MAIIDVRQLFDTIDVQWRDRGKNTSRNNITINCPFCGSSDYSGHLKVSEEKEAYYCLRDDRHAGTSIIRLLTEMGISRDHAIVLRNSCVLAGSRRTASSTQAEKQRVLITAEWNKFSAASDNSRMVDYLKHRRGFDNAYDTIRRYDLRYALRGEWAWRLLFPLPEQHAVEAWTGRDISDTLEPKYRMSKESGDGMIYLPRGPRSTMVIVEGPMDALKIVDATEHDDVSAIALLGKAINDPKRQRIMDLCNEVSRVIVALDNDASLNSNRRVVTLLRSLLRDREIIKRRLPKGYKDAGEAPFNVLREWVR